MRACRDRRRGAGSVDDVDAGAGVPRTTAGETRAAAAEEDEGAAANAEGEYSEPDLELTGFQQLVDQRKTNREKAQGQSG